MPDKKFLTSEEACNYLGINRSTLYGYIKSGKLQAYKLGGSNSKRRYRFTLEALDAFVTTQSS